MAERRAEILSHPMWVRGLKLLLRYEKRNLTKSHPMWVRGLKQSQSNKNNAEANVAPHVGAWIETSLL